MTDKIKEELAAAKRSTECMDELRKYKKESGAYHIISDFYGDKTTRRSGVRLINHIDEGLKILFRYKSRVIQDASSRVFRSMLHAYCLHPLFQEDKNLITHGSTGIDDIDPVALFLVMEYRNIANRSLSDIIATSCATGEIYKKRDIILSPIREVNWMLVADKIQNYKDFQRYHSDSHPRSDELDVYFKMWLNELGVPDQEYRAVMNMLDEAK